MTWTSDVRPTGVFGAELSESQAALRVFLAAGGLALLGLLLLLLTIRWWRGTRPEPPALGPLEVMGDRRWSAAPDPERRRILEEFRPVGASAAQMLVEPVPLDLSILAREAPPGFDDLRDPPEPDVAVEPDVLATPAAAGVDTHAAVVDVPAAPAPVVDVPVVNAVVVDGAVIDVPVVNAVVVDGTVIDGMVSMFAPEHALGRATGIDRAVEAHAPPVDPATDDDDLDRFDDRDETVAMMSPDRRGSGPVGQ